ncbi:MAG: ATP-binding protein [Candidatus Omnitrophica bacterium]|nr:ATP-binding protein [Candidatus Omnitrophota bacterium]
MKYIHRQIEGKLKKYVEQFPVVVLTGARQAGKSTLLKQLFKGENWEYVSFDQRGILERVKADPDLFVRDISSNIIIDEAQKVPELFHSIKWRVDEGLKYKIILSGSANFQLLNKVTETLAGRAGVLDLFPFSISEKYDGNNILEILFSSKDILKAADKIKSSGFIYDEEIFHHVLWGGYPKLIEYKDSESRINWLENYRTTYIERDLRDLTQVANISDFQRFYQMLAFQVGNILNLSNLANDIGVTVPTCKKYFQILEASYQYFILKPYHLNIRKRLIKSPKIYSWDTGLCNYFLGNTSIKELKGKGTFGNIFENYVMSEIAKQNSFLVRKSNMYFWRTANGAEVDLIMERGEDIIPVEIKSSVKLSDNSLRGLFDFMKLKTTKRISLGIVFYRGDKIYRLTDNVLAVPIGYL